MFMQKFRAIQKGEDYTGIFDLNLWKYLNQPNIKIANGCSKLSPLHSHINHLCNNDPQIKYLLSIIERDILIVPENTKEYFDKNNTKKNIIIKTMPKINTCDRALCNMRHINSFIFPDYYYTITIFDDGLDKLDKLDKYKDTLVHELIHVYDKAIRKYCFNNEEYHIKTELNAYKFTFREIQDNNTQIDNIVEGTLSSVRDNFPDVTEENVRQYLDILEEKSELDQLYECTPGDNIIA